MRNFDYLPDLGLTDLHSFCATAEELQVSNPDLSAISARKALEYVVRSLYVMKHIETKALWMIWRMQSQNLLIRQQLLHRR